jgi:small subunit ribosomal protein S6
MLHSSDFLPRLAPSVPERRTDRRGRLRPKEGEEGNVNDYEILLMLNPELPEERADEILARTRELIERSGGAWEGHDAWGRRKLAYEIDHKGEGVYHLVTFRSETATLDEVSRVLKITDGVMRHMATRRPKVHRRSPVAARPRGETAPPEEYAAARAAETEEAT